MGGNQARGTVADWAQTHRDTRRAGPVAQRSATAPVPRPQLPPLVTYAQWVTDTQSFSSRYTVCGLAGCGWFPQEILMSVWPLPSRELIWTRFKYNSLTCTPSCSRSTSQESHYLTSATFSFAISSWESSSWVWSFCRLSSLLLAERGKEGGREGLFKKKKKEQNGIFISEIHIHALSKNTIFVQNKVSKYTTFKGFIHFLRTYSGDWLCSNVNTYHHWTLYLKMGTLIYLILCISYHNLKMFKTVHFTLYFCCRNPSCGKKLKVPKCLQYYYLEHSLALKWKYTLAKQIRWRWVKNPFSHRALQLQSESHRALLGGLDPRHSEAG